MKNKTKKQDAEIGDFAKARALNVASSYKHGYEVCKAIRGKDLNLAKQVLIDAIKKKKAIPYTRFNRDLGHKRAVGPGRYPVKTCKIILRLLDSVSANAQDKGLNSSRLFVYKIACSKGQEQMHFGRKRRRSMKRSNFDIIVTERANQEKADKKKSKVAQPVKEKKVAAPKEEKKIENKKQPKEEKKVEGGKVEEKKKQPLKKEIEKGKELGDKK